MINSVNNNFTNANTLVSDNNKANFTVDTKVSDLPPKEIVNKLDGMDLTIKDQVAKLADGPPIDRSLVNEIKTKVTQGRYPIDINIDSHLFLDKLEQMKELLSSPGIRSRANESRLTKTIAEFYQLIDEYADKQSSDAESEDHSNELKSILNQLTSKIDVIEKHVDLNLNKLDFLSDVTPKT